MIGPMMTQTSITRRSFLTGAAALVAAAALAPFAPEEAQAAKKRKAAVIYFVGPTPAKPGQAIGSAGPTTSYRMDAYSPAMIAAGETGMIGKGKRSAEVVAAMKEHGAVYFAAIGGAGALLSSCIKKAEIVCYEDLGAEAVRRLEVENLPVVCVIDSEGNNLYETGRKAYLETV